MIISKEQLSVLQGFKLHTWNVFHNKTPNMFKFWADELDKNNIWYKVKIMLVYIMIKNKLSI